MHSPYSFAFNDPLRFDDPSGLYPEKEKGGERLLVSCDRCIQLQMRYDFLLQSALNGVSEEFLFKVDGELLGEFSGMTLQERFMNMNYLVKVAKFNIQEILECKIGTGANSPYKHPCDCEDGAKDREGIENKDEEGGESNKKTYVMNDEETETYLTERKEHHKAHDFMVFASYFIEGGSPKSFWDLAKAYDKMIALRWSGTFLGLCIGLDASLYSTHNGVSALDYHDVKFAYENENNENGTIMTTNLEQNLSGGYIRYTEDWYDAESGNWFGNVTIQWGIPK